MKCDFCDAEVDDRDLQCATCKADVRYSCSSCGHLNPIIEERCSDCGTVHDSRGDEVSPHRGEPDDPPASLISFALKVLAFGLVVVGIIAILNHDMASLVYTAVSGVGCVALAQTIDVTTATSRRVEKMERLLRRRRSREKK